MKQNRSIQDGLRKWINGHIRAKEEAQLDQLSQEDDFARDALEGLRSFADVDHTQNLQRLRKQLQKEKKPVVIIPIMVQRIAAAVLLLVVVGLAWWVNQPNKTGSLTMDEVRQPKALPTPSPSEEAQLSDAETPPQETTTENTPPLTEPKEKRPKPAAPPPIMADEDLIEVVEEAFVEYRNKSTAPAIADPAVTNQLPQAKESLPLQTINGRILDTEGQPVAGALIQNLTNQQITRSDLAGNFSIQQALEGKAAGVQVSHFNYADTTLNLKMDQGLEINLQSRIADLSFDDNTQQPYPVGGFAYFQTEPDLKEARKNTAKKSREAAVKPPVGTTIRFTVYADGSLGNFQILASPDKKSERAALKRLKQGPKWILPSGLDRLDTQITIPMQR